MRFSHLVVHTVILLLLAGCQASVQEQDIEPIVQSPHGAYLTFHLHPGHRLTLVRGELLDAAEHGYLIEVLQTASLPTRLLFIHMDVIDKIEFSDGRKRPFPAGAGKRQTLQETLRYLARFPQGVSPELAETLKAAWGVAQIESFAN